MSVNRVMLIGNLGKDPEVRFTPSGRAVARFPLATSEVWNDAEGQRQERTEWHNIVVWGSRPRPVGSTSPRDGRYTSRARSAPGSTTTRKGTGATSPRSSRSGSSSSADGVRRGVGAQAGKKRRPRRHPLARTTTSRSERAGSPSALFGHARVSGAADHDMIEHADTDQVAHLSEPLGDRAIL